MNIGDLVLIQDNIVKIGETNGYKIIKNRFRSS